MNEREIFAAALEQPTEAKRQAFLDNVCDDDMRQRIERLLREQCQLGSFLEHPALEAAAGALGGIEPTIMFGDGSTCDDGSDAISLEQRVLSQNPQDPEDEIPLGYLEQATREDSLGRLGHYEILEVVGRGAFGTVLRAFDEKLQRVVAIKVLAPEIAATSPARKRFLREARTSAAVRHENVVAIYAVEDEPIPYLVMEYIPGKTLQQRLDEQGPLDLLHVTRLGKQIADGLAAAHEQGLIHRDIKPGNILLERDMDDRVKITDFGLARAADDASMTQSGMIAGTPMYMAPEQAQGQKLDQRADLFSFGSVLYQMLSGRPPFRAPNTVAVLKRVVEDIPRPIQEIIPEVPDWMCKLIEHLHAKDPDERYGSAKEVSDLLARCLADVQEGREPRIPLPTQSTGETELWPPLTSKSRDTNRTSKNLLGRIAAVAAVLFVSLGLAEASGVTGLSSTVIRMLYGSGTLVIEVDDPNAKIAINGEEVSIQGAGVDELTLRPGEYSIEAAKDGQTVQQELVSITRNGRTVVRMTLEPVSDSIVTASNPSTPMQSPPPLAVAPFDEAQAKQRQQAWADYLGVPVEKEIVLGQDKQGEDVKLVMVLIPPGEFLMGTNDVEKAKWLEEFKARKPDGHARTLHLESPQHFVRITKPFWLGKYEFTTGQFGEFVESSHYKTDAETNGKGGFEPGENRTVNQRPEANWGNMRNVRADYGPVVNVSWNDAHECCQWLTSQHPDMEFSLPTEAQWEYACRAGTTTPWSGCATSEELKQLAQFEETSNWMKPGGQLRPNAFGLHDMHGNVWEWCSDWGHRYYYRSSPTDDPPGSSEPDDTPYRVTRGGAFYSPPSNTRSAKRGFSPPESCFLDRGFRVAAALPEDTIRANFSAESSAKTDLSSESAK